MLVKRSVGCRAVLAANHHLPCAASEFGYRSELDVDGAKPVCKLLVFLCRCELIEQSLHVVYLGRCSQRWRLVHACVRRGCGWGDREGRPTFVHREEDVREREVE